MSEADRDLGVALVDFPVVRGPGGKPRPTTEIDFSSFLHSSLDADRDSTSSETARAAPRRATAQIRIIFFLGCPDSRESGSAATWGQLGVNTSIPRTS